MLLAKIIAHDIINHLFCSENNNRVVLPPLIKPKYMDLLKNAANVQLVVNANDLRAIVNEWQQEKAEKDEQLRNAQKKEEYLRPDEVCDILKVTKPTLWRWAKLGYLQPVKVGHKNYYRKTDVDALIARKG